MIATTGVNDSEGCKDSTGVGGHSIGRPNLRPEATAVLLAWFSSHHGHPYPTSEENADLCKQTGLSKTQLKNWFSNKRRRDEEKEKKKTGVPSGTKTSINPEAPSDAKKPRAVRKQRQEVIRHGQPEKLSLQVRKAAEHTHFCVDIRVFYSTHLKKTDEVILKVAVTMDNMHRMLPWFQELQSKSGIEKCDHLLTSEIDSAPSEDNNTDVLFGHMKIAVTYNLPGARKKGFETLKHVLTKTPPVLPTQEQFEELLNWQNTDPEWHRIVMKMFIAKTEKCLEDDGRESVRWYNRLVRVFRTDAAENE